MINLKESLNDSQYQAATHMSGPAVVIAGAGSGKTHTLTSRVAYLLDNWVPAERILMLTFTNAVADEMKVRAEQISGSKCDKMIACTYHRFCNIMLRKYGKFIGLHNYTIITPAENKTLIDYVKSSDDRYKDLQGFPTSKTLLSIFSKSVNCQTTITNIITKDENLNKYIDYIPLIEQLFEDISIYCFNIQKFNYDDLLLYMNKLLDNDEICEKIANSFDHIMVDEFQDTNNLQEEILLKLSKYNKNIMVVGDISQSIYAFRGANSKNLQYFDAHFEHCEHIVLDTNYRSSQQILDFANSVMNNNKKSWPYYNMKSADNKQGDKPKFVRPMDNYQQCAAVLQCIKDYHNKGINYSDMAIIERGSMSSFEIEAELNRLDIPFDKRGGMKLMDYECVGDILTYLTLIVKPYDNISWFRILKIHPYIGDVTARKIADTCKNTDFLIDKKYSKNKYFVELQELFNQYNQFRLEEDFHKLYDTIVKFYFDVRTRAVQNSRMREDTKQDALDYIERDKTILDQVRNMVVKYDKISDFLDDLILDSISEEEKDEDRLIITTVHSAKGLEWKIVFIIDCINGSFPAYINSKEQYGSEEDEEELRCFYVAITRAKDQLYIFSPKMHMHAGIMEPARPTHYLDSVDNNTLDFHYIETR